nr:hypothetical protein TetV2_00012 [Oceanusvirus sp.]
MTAALVTLGVVFVLSGIVLVFGFLGGPGRIIRNYPNVGETVVYAEVGGDGRAYRYRRYAFDGEKWANETTCYTSTGKGCGRGGAAAHLPVFPPAVSVTHPNEKVEIDNDEAGFLRDSHPRSGYHRDDAYWAAFA